MIEKKKEDILRMKRLCSDHEEHEGTKKIEKLIYFVYFVITCKNTVNCYHTVN